MTDTATDSPQLLTDAPAKAEEDLLGFALHAKRLAALIQKQIPDKASFVIGIEGEWGEGKSSFINCLKAAFPTDDTRPTIVDFNPWWFEGSDQLLRHFFDELLGQIDWTRGDGQKLFDSFSKLAAFAGRVGKLMQIAPEPMLQTVGKVAEGVGQAFGGSSKPESFRKLRDAAADTLSALSFKTIVFIDDLDRLPAREIVELFRVIKAVADLPNIVYVIAYDRAIVASALDEVHKGKGEAYLEKIVQLPYRLPKPTPAAFKAYWRRGLGALPSFKDKLADLSADTADCLQVLVDAFVQTPRDMKRLYANLLLNDSVAQQLGITAEDFAFLEAMRLKNGALWRSVAKIWTEPDQLRELKAGGDYNQSVGNEGQMKPFPWGMQEAELAWMKDRGIDFAELPSATKSALMYFFGWSERKTVQHRELAATELVSMWAALRSGNEQEMQRLARAWQSYLQYAREAGTDDS
ncbi:MAG: KAP family P-loop NTPase fold protein [Vogesella sp.]|uniref:KAP family P-loop NTPase fold protein n=1 Tax=Vogesella sp. TaxID=1904252 RepID=UPI003F38FF21